MHAGSKSPESKLTTARPKWLIPLGLALIILATLIAYIPAARAGFIWNDNSYVHQNPLLAPPTLSSLAKIWSITPASRLDGQRFYAGHTEQYYPLVFTTYWLESLLWSNTSPAGFHITNILLHIANALLIWLICRRLDFPWAYLLALLFALHPVHVESVAWITERKNVLSAFFYLLALLTYLRYDHSAQKRFYFLALACFALALLSKTVTATLPAVLLLMFWTKRGRIAPKDILALIPFFVLGIVLGLFTAYLERHSVGAEWQIAFWQRCVIAGRAVFFYLSKLLCPVNLSFIYPRWNPADFSPWALLWPAAAVLLTVALYYWRKTIGRLPLLAWLAFIITLFPALGFFDVYPFRYSFVADHFQYLASIFPLALFAALAHRFYKRFHPQPFSFSAFPTIPAMLSCTLVLLLASLTWLQAVSYKDSKTLWLHTTRKNPQAWMAWNNLASIYMYEEDFPTAQKYFQRAILVRPDYAAAHANLGWALAWQEKFDLALSSLNQAIKLRPDYPFAHLHRANICAQLRRYEQAIAAYKKAISLAKDSVLAVDRPRHVKAHSNLAAVYAELGRYTLAVAHAQQAFDLARHYNLPQLAGPTERQLRDYRKLAGKD
ncbi:MAG: tetratricopeptide repeat protein [Phycisphaerae bacterium]|nr:tetratricopeptide repeat protein [Phycisphaerae bacterium]